MTPSSRSGWRGESAGSRRPGPGTPRPAACRRPLEVPRWPSTDPTAPVAGRAIRELPGDRAAARAAGPARRGRPDRGRADRAGLGSGTRGRSAVDLAADALAATRRPDRARPGDRPRARRRCPGSARRKAAQLVAAFELGRRPARGLADRPLVDPRPARRRGPADPPDGPPRARGAAGRAARHEEPRAARRDRLPGQRQRLAGAGRGAVPRRRPAQRGGRDPRPQPPVAATRRRRRTTCT